MKMKIKDGQALREKFATQKDWWTAEKVARGLKISTRTASKLFNGDTINHTTAKKVAESLGVDVLTIAEFAIKPSNR